MKKLPPIILILTAIIVISLTACTKPSGTQETSPPTAAAVTEAPQSPTAAPTQTQTEPPTEAPSPATEAPTEAPETGAAKDELVSSRWVLTEVIADGVSTPPSVYYGSIIRQTGASLTFYDDNTFTCILGFKGCKGVYEPTAGAVNAHITLIYDGKSANGTDADVDTVMDWDIHQGTITFDFDGVINIFTLN
ncbi:MAG: hypothetical protein IJH07_00365 [Ruminococcus sp.]|nr:hypothetical protein [Ruminococcus sp.]